MVWTRAPMQETMEQRTKARLRPSLWVMGKMKKL